MSRVCECGCGKPIEGDRRKRFYTDACRMRVKRNGSPTARVIALQQAPAATGSVQAAARKELEELSLVDSLLGQTVLALAARIDVGNETGAATAAVAREMRAAMEEAKASAPRAASPVDQLRQKRLERMGLAGA